MDLYFKVIGDGKYEDRYVLDGLLEANKESGEKYGEEIPGLKDYVTMVIYEKKGDPTGSVIRVTDENGEVEEFSGARYGVSGNWVSSAIKKYKEVIGNLHELMASLKKEREEIVDFSLNDYISNDSWGS